MNPLSFWHRKEQPIDVVKRLGTNEDLFEKYYALVQHTKTDAWKAVVEVLTHVRGVLVEERREYSDKLLESGKPIGEKERRFLDDIKASLNIVDQLVNAEQIFSKHARKLRKSVEHLKNKERAS
jgi:hypothetical protein